MRNFYSLAALAALTANTAQAVCATDATAPECSDWTDLNQAVTNYSGDYAWRFYTATTKDGYGIKLFTFTGDSSDSFVTDQFTKSAVLFLAPARQDCSWWLTSVTDTTSDSIPKQLFDAGYDVYLGCKRGNQFTVAGSSPLDSKAFWDFNTDTIGLNDIPAMVGFITTLNEDREMTGTKCKKVQIISQSLGSSEALTTLSLLPTDSDKYLSQLINLAPCAVRDEPTACEADDDSALRRVLSAEAPAGEAPRELAEAVEEDMKEMKRELGDTVADRKLHSYYTQSHSNSHYNQHDSYYYNDFWSRTARYCAWYSDSCYDYCDWYPDYCDEFCVRFPTYCEEPQPQQPQCVADQYAFYDFLAASGIYSMFGPTWSDQVDAICGEFGSSSAVCIKWTDTVDKGYSEMSVQQGEQLWQQSYTRQFDQYSATFATDGWLEGADQPDIPLNTVPVNVLNAFVTDDAVCDETFNANLLEAIPSLGHRTTFFRDNVDNFNIGVSNRSSTGVVDYLLINLEAGNDKSINNCDPQSVDFSDWNEDEKIDD